MYGLFCRLAETSTSPQEEFCSHLSDEGLNDADYAHACLVKGEICHEYSEKVS